MIKTVCDRCGGEKETKHYTFPMLNEYYTRNRKGEKLTCFFKYEDIEVDLCRECELILANVISDCINKGKENEY